MGQSDLSLVSIGIMLRTGFTVVFAVVRRFLNLKQNLMQAVDGPVFMKLQITIISMN